MKTEYKKVSELLALENAEVLNEFEMVELQGGKDFWACDNATGNGCTITNISSCLVECFCLGNPCKQKP